MRQTVMWTVLPNGIVDGRLRLSVFVSPRLVTEGAPERLDTYPDWLDWPATQVSWAVTVDDGDPLPATVVSPAPRSDLWQALFSPDTLVRDHSFTDYTHRVVHSYPAAHIVRFLRQRYTTVATTTPTEYPDAAWLLGDDGLGPITYLGGDIGDLEPGLTAQLERGLRRRRALPPGPPNPRFDFLQLRRFHRAPAVPLARPEVPQLDFHQAVAMCTEHPELARLLGLVYDLEIDEPVQAGGVVRCSFEPAWLPKLADSVNALPATRAVVGDDFRTAPRALNPELVDGRLPLDDTSRYQVVQVDADGAGLKALTLAYNLANTFVSLPGHVTIDTPERYSLPSLRSGGLSVARAGEATLLVQSIDTGATHDATLEDGGDVVLDAEDLIRGYRLDIHDDRSGQWHSLHRRVGEFRFLGPGTTEVLAGEGFVNPVPSSRDDPEDDLYLQESLFRWAGWSLAASRPGRTLNASGEVEELDSTAQADFPLEMRFRAEPASLPRLRYGVAYRVSARAVDLAGNSVELVDPNNDPFARASAPEVYSRFEPVQTPTVLLASPRTEGESVEHVVLRSDIDTDPSPTTVHRHLAPPKVSQLTAEEHGLFDTPGMVDPAAYAGVVAREAGSFATSPQATPDPNGYDQPYFLVPALEVPYLPDPVARGLSLRGLPGAGPEPDEVLVSFAHPSDPWPASWPVRLVLAGGEGPPQVAEAEGQRAVLVRLPQAGVAHVRLSAYLGPDDLPLMGIWRWMISGPGVTAGDVETWTAEAEVGRHWMLTPYRTLTLVHAVRRPLATPEMVDISFQRDLDQTFLHISGGLSVHRASTGRLDLDARWSEPVDTGPGGGVAAPAPVLAREHHEVPFQVPLDGEGDVVGVSDRHEFGDTKYRQVTYTLEATTSFSEYFLTRVHHPLPGATPVVLDAAGVVRRSEGVDRIDGSVRFERDTDYTVDYEAGTVARVPFGSIGDGEEVRVSFLVPPVSRTSEQERIIDVLSSARPPAPKVLYVVPTFAWNRIAAGGDVQSTRTGGGLRVYLDRPWFASGEGELLAVLVFSSPVFDQDPPEHLRPYVTRWGTDPVYATATLPGVPTPSRFPLAAADGVGTQLALEEIDATVTAVGHTVAFDPERALWYCDIEVDTGASYLPFIRLALARYQPHSMAAVHLSRVVLADFVQLAPDRTATVTRTPGDPGLLQVSVSGPAYSSTHVSSETSEVTVGVERQQPAVGGDLGWAPAGTPGSTATLEVVGIGFDGSRAWAGTVRVPVPRRPRRRRPGFIGIGSDDYRLVIDEYERLPDDPIGGAFIGPAPLARRIVYSDLIPL